MIKVEHLTKRYGGFTAVRDLSFEIEEGHVYGFLGPNGAGKSTTMNIMTGCLSPTDGRITIGGYDILEEPEKAKKLIGYLPEQPPLYMNETPLEYLTFVGEAKGLKGQELYRQVEETMEQVGLTKMQNRLIHALSKGYKQRVGIAQALLGNPKVIILDEPTVGLDPLQIIEIRDLIKKLGESHTVILSSHILSEVQAICEKVLIISKGRLAAFDTPENLEKQMTAAVTIHMEGLAETDKVENLLKQYSEITSCTVQKAEQGYFSAELKTQEKDNRAFCSRLLGDFVKAGISICELHSVKHNLEDAFIELTESDEKIVMKNDNAAEQTGESSSQKNCAEQKKESTDKENSNPDSDETQASDSNEKDIQDSLEGGNKE